MSEPHESSASRSWAKYFDWNATTPPLSEALDAYQAAAREAWGNPSSIHGEGRAARRLVEDCREALAQRLGNDPRDLILTGGGTEANNLALHSAPALMATSIEHPSITQMLTRAKDTGKEVRWIDTSSSGVLDLDSLRKASEELPIGAVLALASVNHETGVLQPTREAKQILLQKGQRLHIDAVQAFGKLPMSSWVSGDTIAVAAHKHRGIKGIGALAYPTGSPPPPYLLGGSQEKGLRPGTQDAALCAAWKVAIEHSDSGVARYQALGSIRDNFEEALKEFAQVNGGDAPRAPHVSNLSFYKWRGDELVAALDLAGFRVSSGSACTAGTAEPSQVIQASFGRSRAESAVRFSFGELSTAEDVELLIKALLKLFRS